MARAFHGSKNIPTWLAAATAALVLGLCPAAAADLTVHEYDLDGGSWIQVLDSGSLQLARPNADGLPLRIELLPPSANHWSRTRNELAEPFRAVVHEGQEGGNRGFSTGADDDGDGLIDEDRLDGRDNDGDGRVDEDFQAISDAMTVLHLPASGGDLHLEAYHWAYAHLRQVLFLQVDQDTEPSGAAGRLRLLTEGSVWRATEIFSRRHAPGGRAETVRGTARVTFVPGPGEDEEAGGTWLGVLVLGRGSSDGGLKEKGLRLEMPLAVEPVQLAVCAAPSWLQLNRALCEAKLVHEGVTDPVSGKCAHWITPAICSRCRLADAPTATWLSGPGTERQIVLRICKGQSGLIDPDLLGLADGPLGSPLSLAWRPQEGRSEDLAWSRMTVSRLDRPHGDLSDPYGKVPAVLTHDAAGELVLRFPTEIGSRLDLRGPVKMHGVYLDGRPFTTVLRPGSVSTGCLGGLESRAADRPAGALGSTASAHAAQEARSPLDERPSTGNITGLSLSPELLKNFPNPFRDITMVQFRVPATVGEAFAGQDGELPVGIEPTARVPWGQGPPLVTVKIYSIDGQELANLHEGYEGPGGQTVQWNGRDASGRAAASGTYFCKLQIGEWSVTHRLSLLR